MRVLSALLYELGFLSLFLIILPFQLSRLDQYFPDIPLVPLRAVGAVLVISGLVLSEYCLALLIRRGHGIQAPFHHPTELVRIGPYRILRNPMSLGFLAMLLGVALAFSSVALFFYALLMAIVVHALIVLREEPALRRRYRDAWDAYVLKVPRWLPRVPSVHAPISSINRG